MKYYNSLNNYIHFVVSLLLAFVAGPAFSLTASDGKHIELSGHYSTSGGQAAYSLPLSVSPGRSGHQPSLSLEYRSDSPNGLLGMGWSIGGTSSITRCGKNIRKDGRWGGVSFNNDDRFCLDGQRLIAISGRDGENLTEYRTETNGFAKIISFGRSGNGPESFKIWYKNGLVQEYGVTADSRVELPKQTHVYKWALNKVTDTSKENHITFSYSENNQAGKHKLSSVNYIGGKINFIYESRADKTSQYLNGSLLTRDERLAKIETYDSQDTKIGSYNLTYQQSAGTSRSQLAKINYCANGQCSTDLVFKWGSRSKVSLQASKTTGLHGPSYYDTNGDGISELYGVVSQNSGKLTVKGLNGQTHTNATSYSLVGSTLSPSIKINQCKTSIAISYIKSDGLFGSGCQVAVCSGHNCKTDKEYLTGLSHFGDFTGNGLETSQMGYSVVDINGDGIDDKHNFNIKDGSYKYQITGGSFQTLPSPGGRVLKTFTDINNDGYLDAIMGSSTATSKLYVHLFNGQSFNAPFSIPLSPKHTDDVFAADLNNDGYPEIGFGQHFYQNNTKNGFSTSSFLNLGANIYSVQDVNGDGWVDVLTRSSGVNDKAHIRYSTAYAQDKITLFSEFGIDYNVTYKSAVGTNVHKKSGSSAYPYQAITPRRYLVSNVVKSPRGYESTAYSYHYEGARTHLKGGGFLGFKKITEVETAEIATTTTTTFEQDNLESAGEPLRVEVKRNGKLVSDTLYTYKVHTRQGYSAKYYQVYAGNVIKKKMSLQDSLVEQKETITRTMDRFGNLLEETSVLASDIAEAGQFTSHSQFSYLSTGINSNHHIYDITSVSNIDNLSTLLSTFKAGLGRYCAANGDIYFKPNDHIVLIHSDVDIPLVLKRYNNYFKYQRLASNTDLDGLTVYSGQLINTSQNEFVAADPRSCGGYSFGDSDGDGNMEFSSSKLTRTELVTETGDNFWKIGAVASSTSTLTDNTTNLSRTESNHYSYSNRGLITSGTLSTSDYESSTTSSMGSKTVTKRYGYDEWGNVVSQSIEGTDFTARTTTTQFDSQGLYVSSSANALGHHSSVEFNAQGLIKKSVSALKARTTMFTYDAFGRALTETLPGVGNTNRTQYQLGAQCGQHSVAQTVSCVSTSPAAGGQVITHFDYAGREVRKLHTGFSGQMVVVDTRWDRNGRKLSVTRPQFVSKRSAAPIVTFTYDALNREISKKEPADRGKIAEFKTSYEGYKTKVVDARGFRHSTFTNVMGQILRKDEPHGAYQTYQYYPDGKLRSSTDANGNTTQIRYDNLGHRSSLDDPDMGKWSYTYNIAGELTWKRDAKGIVTTLEYDNLGRKVKQTEGGKVSNWRFDERGALGTLSGFSGNGSQTDYYYNESGLTEEIAVKVKSEKFSTYYYYDKFERVAREVRPNGVDTTLAGAAKLLSQSNSSDKMALEYVYNPNGYVAAVRSPKSYADEAFTSASFREDIKQLLNQAISQASEYLTKAERYSTQESFFSDKASEYNSKTVNVHNLDGSSEALLNNGYRYKQWCNSQGECYLRPATWVILHDDVSIPLDITLEGAIYRLTTSLASSSKPGTRNYNATVHAVSESEFSSQTLTPAHDFLLTDYDKNGQKDLMSNTDIYIAQADSETREELLFSADDLSQAATVASTRYQFYTDLAAQLIDLSEKVAELSGLYCEYANQLGGNQLNTVQRSNCENTQQSSQADHLNLILTQSELEDSLNNPAYLYYWQRRETDAYDHTLSEILGNGLANTYSHDANTGRPSYIATHKANALFDTRIAGSTHKHRNVRLLQYRYDSHNNVIYRSDEHLGITDRWQYDGMDRVEVNIIALANKAQHGVNNQDLIGPFVYKYDKLGNMTFKSGIGTYQYGNQQAGPHAVTQANGLNYQYDDNGNMLRAWTESSNANERELEWTAFNKPQKIMRNGKTVEFLYDANHNRYWKKNSDGIETFYFGKSYERVTNNNTGEVQHKHFVYADGKLIALNTQVKDAENKLKDKQVRYLHYDALNSVDMITDGYGLVVERRSYDTWGKQRKVSWREDNPLDVIQLAITNRGYTGHEEIVEVGLVHMNGRVYDQELGRFISPDPIIQAPYVTNSFNRYSYVMNNPLKYADPTGYFWSGAGTCNTDGTTSDLSGNQTGRWDGGNGNGRDRDQNKSTTRPSQPKRRPGDDKSSKPLENSKPPAKLTPELGIENEAAYSPSLSLDSKLTQGKLNDSTAELGMETTKSTWDNTVDAVVNALNITGETIRNSGIDAKAGAIVGLSVQVKLGSVVISVSTPHAKVVSVLSSDEKKQGIDVVTSSGSFNVRVNDVGLGYEGPKVVEHYHPSKPDMNTKMEVDGQFGIIRGGVGVSGNDVNIKVGGAIYGELGVKF
ncbi:RHS repeat-associated core domain-containing protein [Vibrio amylolyticus]|uniref:RHS repeat-associated core domain-containing protein n=1 Tax=Vibrio amylolyticus TaxID=2847292 RepID=UPI00354AEA5C